MRPSARPTRLAAAAVIAIPLLAVASPAPASVVPLGSAPPWTAVSHALAQNESAFGGVSAVRVTDAQGKPRTAITRYNGTKIASRVLSAPMTAVDGAFIRPSGKITVVTHRGSAPDDVNYFALIWNAGHKQSTYRKFDTGKSSHVAASMSASGDISVAIGTAATGYRIEWLGGDRTIDNRLHVAATSDLGSLVRLAVVRSDELVALWAKPNGASYKLTLTSMEQADDDWTRVVGLGTVADLPRSSDLDSNAAGDIAVAASSSAAATDPSTYLAHVAADGTVVDEQVDRAGATNAFATTDGARYVTNASDAAVLVDFTAGDFERSVTLRHPKGSLVKADADRVGNVLVAIALSENPGGLVAVRWQTGVNPGGAQVVDHDTRLRMFALRLLPSGRAWISCRDLSKPAGHGFKTMTTTF